MNRGILVIYALAIVITLVYAYEANLFTQKKVIEWAKNKSITIMTFEPIENLEGIDEKSQYFTDKGWRSFLDALEKAGFIDFLKEDQNYIEAKVMSFPGVDAVYMDQAYIENLRGAGKRTKKLSLKQIENLKGKWFVKVPIRIFFLGQNHQKIVETETSLDWYSEPRRKR